MVWETLANITSRFLSNFSQDCVSESSEEEMDEMDDSCSLNGLKIKGKTIPVEVLCSILKWLDCDSLVFSCRLVCLQWRDVIDNMVWEDKIGCTKSLVGHKPIAQVPWWIAYWISKIYPLDVFNRNLLQNNCGQAQLNHWDLKQNSGDGWVVENEPVGTLEQLPKCDEIGNNKSCFTSSFSWCIKYQVVKLSKVGLSDKIMDEVQPDFEFSEWIATRFDCGGVYILRVCLLDANRELIGDEVADSRELQAGEGWEKVSCALLGPYPPGARYLCFCHGGKDNQFWKGHYGIKITGSVAKAIFPRDRFFKSFQLPTSKETSECQELESS